MVWRVDRHNQSRNETQTAAQSFATAAEAFDLAWDNMGVFVKNSIRSSDFGDDQNPRSADARYKIIVEYRVIEQVGFTIRYDYPTGTPPNNPEGTWETNEISWRLRQE